MNTITQRKHRERNWGNITTYFHKQEVKWIKANKDQKCNCYQYVSAEELFYRWEHTLLGPALTCGHWNSVDTYQNKAEEKPTKP